MTITRSEVARAISEGAPPDFWEAPIPVPDRPISLRSKAGKVGRKQGVRVSLLALTPGGSGGQMRKVMRGPDPEWKMGSPSCVAVVRPEEEDDSSYSSAFSMDTDDEELEEELEDVQDSCMLDMVGNRILPIKKLSDAVAKHMCCRKCAAAEHASVISQFLSFSKEYDRAMEESEEEMEFDNKEEMYEWRLRNKLSVTHMWQKFSGLNNKISNEYRVCKTYHLFENTCGIATSVYGVCGNEVKRKRHKFSVSAEQISSEFLDTFHGNLQVPRYSMNYKLLSAIQAIGCVPSDAMTLTAFLDLPSGYRVRSHL